MGVGSVCRKAEEFSQSHLSKETPSATVSMELGSFLELIAGSLGETVLRSALEPEPFSEKGGSREGIGLLKF